MSKLLAVFVLILAGNVLGQTAKAPQPTKTPKEVSAPQQGGRVGRYQLFFSPHARADVYLVDTETGHIWKPFTITNAQDTNLKTAPPEVWVYQDRLDSEQEFDLWLTLHTPAVTAPPK